MSVPPDYLDQIVTGDARELAEAIPDESIDLIFTDPPYPREFLPLYESLAEIGARVLKPGGLCMAYCGKYTMDQTMARMGKYLTYVWTVCIWEPGATAFVFSRKVASSWRPVLVYGKGPSHLNYCVDAWATDGRDKRYHVWGQELSAPSYYLRKLTESNQVILDPFTGGGTVPAVCKMLGRHYVAFEIDPDTAEKARERVANTQPPIPGFFEEQMALEVFG